MTTLLDTHIEPEAAEPTESRPQPESTALTLRQGTPDNPLAILHAALDRGTDPAKLEKLMDLAERWKAERAAEAFASAMNDAQRVMPCVVRDATNDHTKSRYARLETVNTVIKPVYAQHGFSLSFGQEESKLPDHIRIVCDVSHTGGHTRRYHLDCPIDGAGFKGTSNKTGIQAMGSTISYGRRYLALMVFNVTVADQDVDGNAADALDAILEADVLEIEDLLQDKKVNRVKFLEWCKEAKVFVGDEAAVKCLSQKHLAKVLDVLYRKKAPGER